MEWAVPGRAIRLAATALAVAGFGVQALVNAAVPAEASFDPNAAEQQLFNLINQDRAQNGLGPLTADPTLFNIARGAPQQVCGNGVTYYGRAEDMIQRNYFSHQIPPCNSYVWPILQAYGVQYTGAGENIAWNTYSPQSTSVDDANTAFMNSAPHRANILGAYNEVGVGAWAATGPWTDGSGTYYNGVQMYVEIFAEVPVSAPAAPVAPVASPANGSVTLSWRAPFDGASPVTGYTVTPYVAGIAGPPIDYGPAATTVTVPGLTNATAYSFTVAASNNVGTGPASPMSNSVTPSAAFPYSAVSATQYQLTGSDGSTWIDMDTTNLRLQLTPAAATTALISANADLWTATAGVNQDLGIFVSAGGGPDTQLAWKESGGSAGTFSPNAAFVQGVMSVAAGTTYTIKLKWKANIPTTGTIFAGAGSPGSFSPTRLTVLLVPSGLTAAQSTQQYQLANSDGATWTDLASAALSTSFTPASSGTAVIGGNADLWTATAGVNQDLGIVVSGGSYGSGQLVAWKESGGFAGTFSPNAAYVQTAIPVVGGTTYNARLQWKANHLTAAAIFAGAGPIAGHFSPTSLVVRVLPGSAVASAVVSTSQYHLAGSDGTTWTDLDSSGLILNLSSSRNCLALLSGNADLWTANAGFNQDFGIEVNGSLAAWKESGGFAGTFSPNAAYVQTLAPMPSGTYTVKLDWKTNKPAGSATIYAGAGPISGQFSPTSLTAELFCG